jgi:hypothetical protein
LDLSIIFRISLVESKNLLSAPTFIVFAPYLLPIVSPRAIKKPFFRRQKVQSTWSSFQSKKTLEQCARVLCVGGGACALFNQQKQHKVAIIIVVFLSSSIGIF